MTDWHQMDRKDRILARQRLATEFVDSIHSQTQTWKRERVEAGTVLTPD